MFDLILAGAVGALVCHFVEAWLRGRASGSGIPWERPAFPPAKPLGPRPSSLPQPPPVLPRAPRQSIDVYLHVVDPTSDKPS